MGEELQKMFLHALLNGYSQITFSVTAAQTDREKGIVALTVPFNDLIPFLRPGMRCRIEPDYDSKNASIGHVRRHNGSATITCIIKNGFLPEISS